MKLSNILLRSIVVLSMLLGFLSVEGVAAAGPSLNLPTSPVQATFTWDSTINPFGNVVLNGIGSGFDVKDNIAYMIWCIERLSGPDPEGGPVLASLYSTYDPNLPANLTMWGAHVIPWDQINYLLNHKQNASPYEISTAIYNLIEGTVSSLWIEQAARANGTGFIPGPGQIVAVILTNGSGVSSDGDSWQESIMEVPVPGTPLGSLGDRVWADANNNGIQDNGESGVPNIPVTLWTCWDEYVSSTTTGANGFYSFPNLYPGVYKVVFGPLPPSYNGFSPQYAQGLDPEFLNNADSNADANGETDCISVAPGQNIPTIDAGLVSTPAPRLTLGDRVWYDQDQDGIQDANEPGYNGATVALYDNAACTGSPMATTTTMAGPAGFGDGYYQFSNLLAGDYCVQFGDIPAGWSISPADQGDGTNDSSANGFAQIPNINLTANDPNEDMGIYVPGSLGDNVQCLSTGQPLANITVTLFEDFDGDGVADGPAIATTQTDANGFYQFTGLEVALAGDPNNNTQYIVEVDVNDPDLGACNVPVPPTSYNPPLDSDNPNDPNNDFEFSEQPRYSLGDRVWYDQDQDGIQDANEPGYPGGVSVSLYPANTCTGPAMATTTTDGSGLYQFTNLLAGTYSVGFSGLPGGWSVSPANQGGNDALDSDANALGCIENINLTANDPNEDMGIYVPGSLGDNVQCLSTGQPLANITVTLFEDFDGDGVADGPAIATTQTDANGFYQFTGLEVALAGDPNNSTQYIVEVDVNDPDLGTCNVPVPPTSYNPPLDSDNPNDPDNDFAFEEPLPATVGDRVWYDNDGDGVQDAGEMGIPDVTVNLTDCSGNVLFSDVTDGNGNYLFENLPAGTYCVVIDETTLPANVAQTFEKDGSLDGDTQQPLNAGDEVLDVDFGYRPLRPAIDLEKYVLVIPTATGGDLCDTYGKPQVLTMKYIGGSASVNAQDPSKVVISGNPGTVSPVRILATDKSNPADTGARVYFNNQVALGETFAIDATAAGEPDLETNTYFYVYDLNGNLLQSVAFHTSCSQPIQLGDIYGSAQLVGYKDSTGAGATLPEPPAGPGDDADTPPGPIANLGDGIQWTYVVTNTGELPLENATVSDDILGFVCTIPYLEPGDSDSCVATGVASEFGQYANEGKVVAYTSQGAELSDTDPAHYFVPEPCNVCKGGTVELTFQYQGANTARVTVYDDSSPKADKILFDNLLNPGEQFTITPRPGQDKLNNDITIYVGGVFNAKVHTSCSQPIGPGLIAGDFQIIDGRSKDNGLMCPLNVCDPSAEPTVEIKDREVKWNITNNGDLGLEIRSITITWPSANGALDEIKRDGDTIHKGDFQPPTAVINSGWESDANKRTIKPGETDTIKFKFKNNASTSGEYVIRIEFVQGCFVEVNYTGGTSTSGFTCSKPIDELTMVWNGSLPTVYVTAWKGSVGSTALATLQPVSLGQALTVSGFAGSPNDVYWEIFSDAAGTNKIGESTFHLSCSDSDMNGADDCGKPQGDGKDKTGFLNDWLLKGLVDSDETLVCTVP